MNRKKDREERRRRKQRTAVRPTTAGEPRLGRLVARRIKNRPRPTLRIGQGTFRGRMRTEEK